MILAAIKAAALRCDGSQLTQVFASSDQVAVELADLSNEVAADIAASHDWRDLTKIATFTGDASTEAFDKPADYDRMVLGSDVDDPGTWFWGYSAITSVNEWMRVRASQFTLTEPGAWILIGGQFQFWPAPSGQASFPYQSKEWARAEPGTPKAAFTADNDTFVLPERLLTLGLIWRWKAQKGLQYSEDMATYEAALSQVQGRDKGASVLPMGRRSRGLHNARTAYSGIITR